MATSAASQCSQSSSERTVLSMLVHRNCVRLPLVYSCRKLERMLENSIQGHGENETWSNWNFINSSAVPLGAGPKSARAPNTIPIMQIVLCTTPSTLPRSIPENMNRNRWRVQTQIDYIFRSGKGHLDYVSTLFNKAICLHDVFVFNYKTFHFLHIFSLKNNTSTV